LPLQSEINLLFNSRRELGISYENDNLLLIYLFYLNNRCLKLELQLLDFIYGLYVSQITKGFDHYASGWQKGVARPTEIDRGG
jgi:hypothetical protein